MLKAAKRPVTLTFQDVLSPLVLDPRDLTERLIIQWNYSSVANCSLNEHEQVVFRVHAV